MSTQKTIGYSVQSTIPFADSIKIIQDEIPCVAISKMSQYLTLLL